MKRNTEREAQVAKSQAKVKTSPKQAQQGVRLTQQEMPIFDLEEATRLAQALSDEFAGKSASPPDLALSLGISPTSSNWRSLTGSASAYGLTSGGWNAALITLTPLGRELVAPTTEGGSMVARREAVMRPKICSAFFSKYDRAKLPSVSIAQNVLVGMGVARERADSAFETLVSNGRNAGILVQTPTGYLVHLDAPLPSSPKPVKDPGEAERQPPPDPLTLTTSPASRPRVYVSTHMNPAMSQQLRDLVEYGQLDCEMAEQEGLSLLELIGRMRGCSASLISLATDEQGRWLATGLLELGAALALFPSRTLLLRPSLHSSAPTVVESVDFEAAGRLGSDSTMAVVKWLGALRR